MGLFDKKKKGDEAEEKVEERPSLLERLSGGEPIFTDHESDVQFQEEFEAQQKEQSFYKL